MQLLAMTLACITQTIIFFNSVSGMHHAVIIKPSQFSRNFSTPSYYQRLARAKMAVHSNLIGCKKLVTTTRDAVVKCTNTSCWQDCDSKNTNCWQEYKRAQKIEKIAWQNYKHIDNEMSELLALLEAEMKFQGTRFQEKEK